MEDAAVAGSTLSTSEREKLAHILNRLASPYDGERAAAALLATRFIAAHGLTWTEILGPAPAVHRPSPAWREQARALLAYVSLLNSWEFAFLIDLVSFHDISPRQAAKLEAIAEKVRRAGRARAA